MAQLGTNQLHTQWRRQTEQQLGLCHSKGEAAPAPAPSSCCLSHGTTAPDNGWQYVQTDAMHIRLKTVDNGDSDNPAGPSRLPIST